MSILKLAQKLDTTPIELNWDSFEWNLGSSTVSYNGQDMVLLGQLDGDIEIELNVDVFVVGYAEKEYETNSGSIEIQEIDVACDDFFTEYHGGDEVGKIELNEEEFKELTKYLEKIVLNSLS